MKEIKAIIVDDEKNSRDVLRNLLNKHSISIISESGNLINAIDKIKFYRPDVVFLDIQMPNYAGYEIVNFLDKIDFEIIFVTAYNDYAIKAFELCAIDYLVKPIDRQKLQAAVRKLENKLSVKDKLNHYKNLLKTLKNQEIDKIIIPELGDRRIIDKPKIIAIEADGAYTKIHLNSQNKTRIITTSKNLKYYENVLKKDANFFRSHRSWIININYLTRFNRTDSSLTMNNTLKAKITRSIYTTFDSLFNKI